MNPLIPRWSHLRPQHPSRPLTAAQRREYHALRLGLMLAIGMHVNGGFTADYRPVPFYGVDVLDWLRVAFRPMVRHSPGIALVMRLMAREDPGTAWDKPAVLGRHLRRMAVEAKRLGLTPRPARRHRPLRRRHGRRV